jgi:hypothetical protein
MPVRKDDVVLHGILDKGIEMVGDSECEGICEKWMGSEKNDEGPVHLSVDRAFVSLIRRRPTLPQGFP